MNDQATAIVHDTSRRQFLSTLGFGLPTAYGLSSVLQANDNPLTMSQLTSGALEATLRDNAGSPADLSGLDSLVNHAEEPDFDAFDPETRGASAGVNFEHIISGHPTAHNAFSPRKGKFVMRRSSDGKSVSLVRAAADDPWAMSATLQFTLSEPHYVDVDFRCVPTDARRFGARGYAILFFANYMNDVDAVGINFRGIDREGQPESWIEAEAPSGHRDWNQGGTYRHQNAHALEYDAGHNFKLNSWSYDEPRFTRPFYYGRAAHGMTLIQMFNKSYSDIDEIRFSLFKFKIPRFPRPAWDFQYVIRNIQSDREYGFKARLVWKRFIGPDDCLREYESWAATVVE